LRELRKDYNMKWHKFFGWAAIICMACCIYTGYNKPNKKKD
jgi:hypothetical protein